MPIAHCEAVTGAVMAWWAVANEESSFAIAHQAITAPEDLSQETGSGRFHEDWPQLDPTKAIRAPKLKYAIRAPKRKYTRNTQVTR
eukprot:s2334_g9.t1